LAEPGPRLPFPHRFIGAKLGGGADIMVISWQIDTNVTPVPSMIFDPFPWDGAGGDVFRFQNDQVDPSKHAVVPAPTLTPKMLADYYAFTVAPNSETDNPNGWSAANIAWTDHAWGNAIIFNLKTIKEKLSKGSPTGKGPASVTITATPPSFGGSYFGPPLTFRDQNFNVWAVSQAAAYAEAKRQIESTEGFIALISLTVFYDAVSAFFGLWNCEASWTITPKIGKSSLFRATAYTYRAKDYKGIPALTVQGINSGTTTNNAAFGVDRYFAFGPPVARSETAVGFNSGPDQFTLDTFTFEVNFKTLEIIPAPGTAPAPPSG
jgi:hypothetical protein